MSKSKNEKQIDRIKKYAFKWRWIVTELGWKFDMLYCNDYDDMPRDTTDRMTVAKTFMQFDYLSADIYFNLEVVSDLEDEPLEEVIVHELTHMLICPIQENYHLDEYTATTISRVLMRMKSCLE